MVFFYIIKTEVSHELVVYTNLGFFVENCFHILLSIPELVNLKILASQGLGSRASHGNEYGILHIDSNFSKTVIFDF